MFTTQAWQDLLFPGKATDFFEHPLSKDKFRPFEPDANSYSPVNALWLAELSRLIYRHDKEEDIPPPQPTRTSFLTKAKLRQRQFFLSWETDTQAMLVESTAGPAFAALIFRGTEQTPRDMLTDIEVGRFPLDDNNRDVHDGFQKAFDSVWDEIETTLEQLPGDLPLFFTGHSLGAALATLAAEKHRPRAVYTFGSPRVGNQKFVDSLNDTPIYRVVDGEDAVTTLPPEELGFRHAGNPYQLEEKKPAVPHRYFDPPKKLDDHAPINYVNRIVI